MLEALKGDRWTDKTARLIFPVLVWCAKNGKTITYDQVNHWIVDNNLGHSVLQPKYGWPAGAVGHALVELEQEWDEIIPPLNALVVNSKTGMPGDGARWFLERYQFETDHIPEEEWKTIEPAVVSEIHGAIFSYLHWDDVLEATGLDAEPVDPGIFDEDEESSAVADKPSPLTATKVLPGEGERGGWSYEGESEEHKKLKQYVSDHPDVLDFDNDEIDFNQTEYLFASADRADVVIGTGNVLWGIEVKSFISNDADLLRGIFQAVKYQALLRAELKAKGCLPAAYGVLVVERELPEELQNMADDLDIEVYEVKVNV